MKPSGLFLLPFALLYGLVVAIRNLLYDIGIFSSQTFEKSVISVGNLTAGGTGKSPHIEYLLALLLPVSKAATLSRGYGRKTSGFLFVSEKDNYEKTGDEPLQFKKKFTAALVAVDENRKRGIYRILKEHPETEVVLLDDAFQHRSVKPGLNILLTDFSKLYTDDFLLPSGMLREWPSAMKRADIIIVTKTPEIFSPLERRFLIEKINPLPYQHLYFSYLHYGNIKSFKHIDASLLPDNTYYLNNEYSCVLLTGIARTSHLEYYLKDKIKIAHHLKHKDHHRFTATDIQNLQKIFDNIASEKKIILTTEKDAMRLAPFENVLTSLPVFYLPIEVRFHEKDENEFNNQILSYVRRDKIHSELYQRKN